MTAAPIVLSESAENDASNSVNFELPFAMPPKDTSTISDKTQISMGVLLTIGGLVLGSGGAWVWWASNVSARLSSIEQYMSTQNNKVILIDRLDARLTMIETYGAAPQKLAIDQLSKDISDLRRTMELHQARIIGQQGSAIGGSGGGK